MELKDRFLKYVSFDTQSDEESQTFPSSDKQLVLLNYLADEMRTLGLTSLPLISGAVSTWAINPITGAFS